ncbi:antitoxin Xre/MbcA/ParS toxin-binding domain-containing protein [Flavimarina sp. Hel_I_48]|uniref:antitoxin Xre/MbcA/ParS toxin-binding domain-containing protein n=1 Tax=Flavimarina sp. Hel_I_48 TaxID=1392488 RepID=UPI0004DF5FD3|nr:antitoxin Xre/MbcA/ParS toxin-binding domain-containing protein [Flavimarina sp. Hel_I_48]
MTVSKAYLISDKIPDQVNETAVLSYLETEKVGISSLDTLREMAFFNESVIAEWLNINVKTLRNYKNKNTTIKDYVQEKIVLLLSLFKHGKSVFGDYKIFSEWLETANFYFDNKAPASFLTTFSGVLFIDDRLAAMEHGDNI